jgi:hypothetical protein
MYVLILGQLKTQIALQITVCMDVECKWGFGTSGKLLWYDSRNSDLRHIQQLLVPIYGTVTLFVSSTWL